MKLTAKTVPYSQKHETNSQHEDFAAVTVVKYRSAKTMNREEQVGVMISFDTSPSSTRSRHAEISLSTEDLWGLLELANPNAVLDRVKDLPRSERALLIMDLLVHDNLRMATR